MGDDAYDAKANLSIRPEQSQIGIAFDHSSPQCAESRMSKRSCSQRFTEAELMMILQKGATDEEIEAKIRSPRYWTYIVRHPDGFIAAWGRGRSRQTCERHAVRLAVNLAEECFWAYERWSLGHWRFVLWPPTNQSRC
jgi:hypothetical protein